MGAVLLFNISDLRKIAIIRLLAYRYGIRLLEVDPEQQNQTIDRLLKDPDEKALPCPDPFQDEMLVMHDLSGEAFHALLDTLRREGKSVKLKAVVTDHNRKWTAFHLHRELLAEAMTVSKRRK